MPYRNSVFVFSFLRLIGKVAKETWEAYLNTWGIFVVGGRLNDLDQ